MIPDPRKAANLAQMLARHMQAPLLPETFPGQQIPQVATPLPVASPVEVAPTPQHHIERLAHDPHLSRRFAALTAPRPKLPETDVQQISRILAQQLLPPELRQTYRRTFTALVKIALEYARHKGYSTAVTTICFHLVQELVASHLEISRETLWRHLEVLQGLGVLNRDSHKTSHHGLVVSDGTLWAIKVAPNVTAAPRFTREDYKRQYRDLAADIKAGRTAWARLGNSKNRKLQQSGKERLKAVKAEELVAWTLTPGFIEQTPLKVTVATGENQARATVWDVLSVPLAHRQDRGSVVDRVAQGLASTLQDSSVNWYRWMLWQLLRLSDAGQDHWAHFKSLLERVLTDVQEGYAIKPGALFISRLKALEFYELLKNAPPHRVGTAPEATI